RLDTRLNDPKTTLLIKRHVARDKCLEVAGEPRPICPPEHQPQQHATDPLPLTVGVAPSSARYPVWTDRAPVMDALKVAIRLRESPIRRGPETLLHRVPHGRLRRRLAGRGRRRHPNGDAVGPATVCVDIDRAEGACGASNSLGAVPVSGEHSA